jgi:choline dehydrogenase-like flavoprotein
MIHDLTAGTVSPAGDLGLRMDYVPGAEDRRALARGVWACAKLLLAAGAERVLVPTTPMRIFEAGADLDPRRALDLPDFTAVHPMGSVPRGEDRGVAAVGSDGRHHHLAGLWIADGSLFPTSIGGPPQLSIYALALRVGRALVAAPR